MNQEPPAPRTNERPARLRSLPLRVAAFLFLALAVAALFAATASAQTLPPASGDWDVSDTTALSSQTVTVQGNVFIRNGGTLDLTDVTLRIASSYPGEYGIFVLPGGTLDVTRGSVSAQVAINTYRFEIYGTSTIESSTVQDMWGDTSSLAFGIQIYSSDVLIANSTIQKGYRGNILIAGGTPVLRGNLIRQSIYALVDEVSQWCGYALYFDATGVYITNDSFPTLDHNVITLNGAVASFNDPWRYYFDNNWDPFTCGSYYQVYEYTFGFGLTLDNAGVESTDDSFTYNSGVPSGGSSFYINSTSVYIYRYHYDTSNSGQMGSAIAVTGGLGNFTRPVLDRNYGVGLFGNGGSTVFRDCSITNHVGDSNAYYEYYGYGAFIDGGAVMNKCTFTQNSYHVYFVGSGTATLERPDFKASLYGPIYVDYQASGTVEILNASFTGLSTLLYFNSQSGAKVNFYNSSVAESQIYSSWSQGEVNVYWLLQFRVRWVNGLPVAGASALLTNPEGFVLFSGVVDSDGRGPLKWTNSLKLEYANSQTPTVSRNSPLTLYVQVNGSGNDYRFDFNRTTFINITINDPFPPILNIFSPRSDQGIASNFVAVTGNAFDIGSGMKLVRASADGGATYTEADPGSFPYFEIDLTLGDGLYDIIVEGWDQSDGVTTVMLRSVLIDTSPPVVVLLLPVLPTSGAPVVYLNATTVLVKGTAGDDIANLTVNGVGVSVAGGIFQRQVNLLEGPNFFHIVAVDLRGNRALLDFEVIADTVRPALVVTSPPDSLETNRSTVLVEGTCEDGASLVINGEGQPVVEGRFSRVQRLSTGLNLIQIEATDLAGNRVVAIRKVTYDILEPVITLTSPAPLSITRLTTVEVAGSVESRIPYVFVNGIPAPTSAGAFSIQILLVEGANTIVARATDVAGNTGSLTVHVTRDTIAPVLQITSPGAGDVVNATGVRVRGTVVGASNVSVNGAYVPFPDNTIDSIVLLEEGEHPLVVVARDVAGNEFTVTFTVVRDTVPPRLQVNLPLNPTSTRNDTVFVTGTAPGAAEVWVNDQPVGVDSSGNFAVLVQLKLGNNTLNIRAEDSAGNSDAAVRSVVRLAPTPAPPAGLFGLGDASYALLPAMLAVGAAAMYLVWRRKRPGEPQAVPPMAAQPAGDVYAPQAAAPYDPRFVDQSHSADSGYPLEYQPHSAPRPPYQ